MPKSLLFLRSSLTGVARMAACSSLLMMSSTEGRKTEL